MLVVGACTQLYMITHMHEGIGSLSCPWDCRFGEAESLARLLNAVDTPHDSYYVDQAKLLLVLPEVICLRVEALRIYLSFQTEK